MNALPRLPVLALALALGACAAPPVTVQPPANDTVARTPPQLVAQVQRDVERIDHSKDPLERTQVLASATADAQQCVALAPDSGACHYARAQVLGLTARERPAQALALLKDMLASLTRAEALDPAFDHAGPARLSATVLLRAPGWPLGPGDADAAVLAAQRAVEREPAYPPNLITLAQAQARADASAKARASYEQARRAVAAWGTDTPEEAADRAAWQHDVEQGLHDLP